MFASLVLLLSLQSSAAPFPDLIEDSEILKLNQEMEAFLDRNVDSAVDPLNRLRLLFDAIFSRGNLHLTYDNARTRTASETFEERKGNCLSFTNMFVAMARELGLEVRFQEVEGLPFTFVKHGNIVMVNRHVNAAVLIGGRSYVVDFSPDVLERFEYQRTMISDDRAKAQFYNNKGAELLSRREGEGALAHFRRALELDPQIAYVWVNVGVGQSLLGNDGEAEKSYKQALNIDPGELTAMVNLTQLYQRNNRPEEAARFRQKAARFRDQNPYYHYRLGKDAAENGLHLEAIQHYKRAIKRKSREHSFHFALAQSYAAIGDYRQVEKSLKKAHKLALDADNAERYSRKLEMLAALH